VSKNDQLVIAELPNMGAYGWRVDYDYYHSTEDEKGLLTSDALLSGNTMSEVIIRRREAARKSFNNDFEQRSYEAEFNVECATEYGEWVEPSILSLEGLYWYTGSSLFDHRGGLIGHGPISKEDQSRVRVLPTFQVAVNTFIGYDGEPINREEFQSDELKMPFDIDFSNLDDIREKLLANGCSKKQVEHTLKNRIKFDVENINELAKVADEFSIDFEHIIVRFPYVIIYNAEGVRKKLESLADEEIDVTKIIHSFPKLLSINMDALSDKIKYLKDTFGLSNSQIENYGGLLAKSVEHFEKKISAYNKFGIDVRELVKRSPSIIGNSPETVITKINALKTLAYKLGADDPRRTAIDAVKYNGNFLTIGEKKIEVLMALITHMTNIHSCENQDEVMQQMKQFTYLNMRNIDAVLLTWAQDQNIDLRNLSNKSEKLFKTFDKDSQKIRSVLDEKYSDLYPVNLHLNSIVKGDK
jgi:hypothetical protein